MSDTPFLLAFSRGIDFGWCNIRRVCCVLLVFLLSLAMQVFWQAQTRRVRTD